MKKIRFALVLMLTVYVRGEALSLPAADKNIPDPSWIHKLNKQAIEAAKARSSEADRIVGQGLKGMEIYKRCPATQLMVNRAEAERDKHLPWMREDVRAEHESRYPKLMVLVSIGMPMATLQSLAEQLSRVGGKLVFRGMVNNSFRQMTDKLKELGHEALIDPTLFDRLKISQVPTFVHFKNSPGISNDVGLHDRLTGHVSLHFVLDQFARQGEVLGVEILQQQLKGQGAL